MKIAPFEIKNHVFFKKTRDALFYKKTEWQLNTINWEIDRIEAELHHLRPGKYYEEVANNLKDNIEYLKEIKSDIIYFRKHGKMRSKKHSTYGQYYKLNRA